jgi:plasminogen activator
MKTLALAACAALLLASPAALAADANPLFGAAGGTSAAWAVPGLDFGLAGGVMSARSREYVYDNGRKLSQLNWVDKSAYGITGDIAVRFVPWLTARANVFFPIDSNSAMKDYDWIQPFAANGYSHYSYSPDTRLIRGYRVDASLQADLLQGPFGTLGPVIGVQRQQWTWRAYGGSYLYSVNAFRDSAGTFPDVVGISYKQEYTAPYLGVAGSLTFSGMKVTARGYGSPYVFSRDADVHHLRDLDFRGGFARTQMAGGDLRVEIPVTQNLAIFGTASYDRYFLAKGDTKIYDLTNPDGSFYRTEKGSAGVDRSNGILSVGLQARM